MAPFVQQGVLSGLQGLTCAITAGACLCRLLHDLCVHANLCGAGYTELELTVRRTVWNAPWTGPGVRSDFGQAASLES